MAFLGPEVLGSGLGTGGWTWGWARPFFVVSFNREAALPAGGARRS
jgi:hypothetical protein